MVRIDIRLLWAIIFLLFVVVAGFACHLWGVEGVHHCELNTPMEQAQCRAEEGQWK